MYHTVGWMNTKLTLAGLLLFSSAFLFHVWTWKRNLFAGMLLVLSLPVWISNMSRSVLFPLAGVLALLALIHLGRKLRSRVLPDFQFQIYYRFRAMSILIAILLVLFATSLFFHKIPLDGSASSGVRELIQAAGRNTDYQRAIVWNGATDLFLEEPVFGTGPGNFRAKMDEWKTRFFLKYPETMVYVQNAQSGHAHNDLIHMAAIGGIVASLLFLILAFLMLRSGLPDWYRFAMSVFFLAGLFQCYFQDDEVIGPLWAITGYVMGSQRQSRSTGHHPSLPEIESTSSQERDHP